MQIKRILLRHSSLLTVPYVALDSRVFFNTQIHGIFLNSRFAVYHFLKFINSVLNELLGIPVTTIDKKYK